MGTVTRQLLLKQIKTRDSMSIRSLNLVGSVVSEGLALDCCRELFDTVVTLECDSREEPVRHKLQETVEKLTYNVMHLTGVSACIGSLRTIKATLWLLRVQFDLRPIEDYLDAMDQAGEKG
jgi:hypothetical protein